MFKPNDRVICVELDTHGDLIKGQVYTVREQTGEINVYIKESVRGFYPHRFKLYSPSKLAQFIKFQEEVAL
jgi:hypothetical protein